MNLDKVITQIKSKVAIFNGNVAGAAAYANAVADQVWLPTPAAYIIPLDEDSTGNEQQSGLQQIITERIGVIVQLDNTGDRRGQGAILEYDGARTALFSQILDWRPDWDVNNPTANREARGLYYAGGRLVDFDRARLFYQFDFALDITVTEADGWSPDSVALTSIGIHVDAENVYSPTGTFTPSPDAPPHTPTTSPRTSGPDGRDEAALDFELPQ